MAEPNNNEQTFTQADVDRIVGERLARVTKNGPSDEELAEFRAWKGNKAQGNKALEDMTKERDESKEALNAANAKIAKFEHTGVLRSMGVPDDDMDYYEFKVNALVDDKTDFKKAAEAYFKDNPLRGVVKVEPTAPLGAGGGNANTPNDLMNALIRGARK